MQTKKEKLKEVMKRLFGPVSAQMVDSMSEEEAMLKCKSKITAFLGEEKARQEFDKLG